MSFGAGAIITTTADPRQVYDTRTVRMTTQDAGTQGKTGDERGAPVSSGRRALLRGAMATVPTVMTLHSGAALARSSNLVGAGPDAGADGGQYRCLDTETVYQTSNPNVYDLGDPPMAHVTTIRSDTTYYRLETMGSSENLKPTDPVTGPTMCKEGGTFFRKSGYTSGNVEVKRGVLVSATALVSFSGAIRYTDV
jgi:hypothetical protein